MYITIIAGPFLQHFLLFRAHRDMSSLNYTVRIDNALSPINIADAEMWFGTSACRMYNCTWLSLNQSTGYII